MSPYQPTYTGTFRLDAAPADGRLSSPSSQRNIGPILEALSPHMPTSGKALEIASGTGEHTAHFATTFPDITWHPTDVEPERLLSIQAWTDGMANVRPPVLMNVEQSDWPIEPSAADVVILVNLLHLVSSAVAGKAISGAANVLKPGGKFFLYGPFTRQGQFTSSGDSKFHATLVGQNLEIGYKDVADIETMAAGAGLVLEEWREMPANNLFSAWTKGDPERR